MAENRMPKTEAEVERGKAAWSEWRDRNEIIRDRADKIAEKSIEKAADDRKSGAEARKDASEVRAKFLRRVGGGGGGGMKPDTDITASRKLPKMAKGGAVGSASKRADGCAQRGKTKGRMV